MIEIREITKKDFASVEELYRTSIKDNQAGFIQNFDELPDIKKLITEIQNDGGVFYACFIENKAIGMIGLERLSTTEIEITRFHIYKKYQGKKIGQMMFSLMFLWADENKIKKIYLHVTKTQERAIALYKRNGFIVDKEELLSYTIDGKIEEYDSIFMYKDL